MTYIKNNWLVLFLAGLVSTCMAIMMGYDEMWMASEKLHNFYYKPFVYRTLVEWLSIPITKVLPENITAILLFTISGILFVIVQVHVFKMFLVATNNYRAGILALLGLSIFLLTAILTVTMYDLPTMILFGLGLILLHQKRLDLYFVVFILATINRETSFLLTIFFAVWFYKKVSLYKLLSLISFQFLLYVSIQVFIRYYYQNIPGFTAWIRPIDNLKMYADNILLTCRDLFIFVLIGYVIYKNWNSKPIFIRTAFITIFPLLFILWLVSGMAYEYRVFGEIYMIIIALVIPNQWLY